MIQSQHFQECTLPRIMGNESESNQKAKLVQRPL